MESPETWNLLTSSLAVSKLDRIDSTWAFLVMQEIIDPQLMTRLAFGSVIDDVRRQGDITGPSEACRVASRIESMGMTTEAAIVPDPWAKIAQSRLETIQGWQKDP